MIENPQSITDQVMNLAERASEIAKSQQKRIKSIEQSIPTVTDTYSATSTDAMSGVAVASALQSYVPNTLTINSKELSSDITLSASDIGALSSDTFVPTVTDTYSPTSSDGMSGKAVASALNSYVPTTTTVNGKSLSDNITLTSNDVGALPSDTAIPTVTNTYSSTGVDAVSGKAVASALSKYVPTSRTINSKSLSSNITLTASDVGALPSSTSIPTVTDTYSSTGVDAVSGKAVASALSKYVPSSNTQKFSFRAVDSQSDKYTDLVGNYNGDLTWGGKKVLVVGNTSSINASNPAVVVETYRSGDSWYRVWSDGWIEQGGVGSISLGANATITFPKQFTTACVSVIANCYGGTDFNDNINVTAKNLATATVHASNQSAGSNQPSKYIYVAYGY